MAMTRRLAVDLDGCLANFTDSYAKLLTKQSGIKFPKAGDTFPTSWNWEREAGVTPAQEHEVWAEITREGSTFWHDLDPLKDAMATVRRLNYLASHGHDVYFLTNRVGHSVKYQTERWLYNLGMHYPTVILAADKMPVIRALNLDFFVDDKWETIEDVARQAEEDPKLPIGGHIYLKATPYNRHNQRAGVQVVESVSEALMKEGLWQQ